MKRKILLFIMLLCWISIHAQTVFDEIEMNKIQSLILNKEHNKVDSIIDVHLSYTHKKDTIFYLYLIKCLNGYTKVKTYEDPSVIAPYSEYGKKAFEYLKDFIKKNQPNTLQCWPYLGMWAETYNYLNDDIIVDISNFSYQYYEKYKQHDLNTLYVVQKNTYQYLCSSKEWVLAADLMKKFYDIAIAEKKETVIIPIVAAYIGDVYLNCRKHENAEEWYLKSYHLFNKYKKTNNQPYCELLNNIVINFILSHNYTSALTYAKESCDVNKSLYGELSPENVNAIYMLSDVEIGLGRIEDAVYHLENAIMLSDNVPNLEETTKNKYLNILKLINLYLDTGKYLVGYNDGQTIETSIIEAYKKYYIEGDAASAVSLYLNVINAIEKRQEKYSNIFYCFAVEELSNILIKQGKYGEADRLLNHSMEILRKMDTMPDIIYLIYATKGILYNTIHNYDEAIKYYNLARDSYNKKQRNTVGYARIISGLSTCLSKNGNYSLAKEYAEEAYNIYKTSLGKYSKIHADRLTGLNNLGVIYAEINDSNRGKEIFESIINERTSIQNETTKALALQNIAYLYLCENNYSKAESYLNQSMQLKNISNNKKNIELLLILIKCLNKDINAIALNDQLNHDVKNNISDVFGQFSGYERENYWTDYSGNLTYCNNYVAATFKNSHTISVAYDNTLFTKSMLINSEKLLKSVVKNNNNMNAELYYSRIQSLKERMSSKGIPQDSIFSYIDSISHFEKKIIATIPDFSSLLFAQFKTMEDVKKMLSDNEVAIEFTFFPHVTFPKEKTIHYLGAFLLFKEKELPIMIELCSETEFKQLLDTANVLRQNEIEELYNISDSRLYQMIWAKIKPYIPRGATIYYSPSGYLNRINLSAISDGNERLSEAYNFIEVSTTANIHQVKNNVYKCKNAIIYGDINYFEDTNLMALKSKDYPFYKPGDMMATRSMTRGMWDLLPGTKEEINAIGNMMENNGVKFKIYDQNDANEESFKGLNRNAPDLIHIATHGFYFPSESNYSSCYFSDFSSYTNKDYSMYRSGLLFSGANNAWTGKEIPYGVEDGILTADEISRIDLSNTKLVVLSACDTGLGDIDNIDGVFGLQRGFKKAGVGTILMSLWKVPDSETNTLMCLFYDHLLSGQKPHDALKDAQKQMSNSGLSPYYWAGFVLLD